MKFLSELKYITDWDKIGLTGSNTTVSSLNLIFYAKLARTARFNFARKFLEGTSLT